MSTIDKMSLLLSEQGKKQKDLTDYLGIPKTSFTDWKSGRVKSYTKYLPQIAEFFGVSVDYLLGKTDQKEKPTAEGGLEKNTVRFLGRDGKVIEKKLTPELLAYIESIPDSGDNL